nr:MAG: peptidase family M50 [Candidatus Nanosalinarum sp. J07AB56]
MVIDLAATERNVRLAFGILFVLAVTGFLWWDRNKVQRSFIVFFRRTERGLVFIDRLVSKAPRLWKGWGWGSVVVGMLSMPVSLATMGFALFQLTQGNPSGGPSLILPGLVSQNQFNPGVSFIVLEYWVASIAVVMVVHELSHAVVARAEDFELNSVGWVVFGVIPGAFVEPKGENMLPGEESDEDSGKMWSGGSWLGRLKVVSAGSFSNYVFGALFLLASIGVGAAVTSPVQTGYIGVQFTGLENGSVSYSAQQDFPTYESGMRNGTLYELNGTDLRNVSSQQELSNKVRNFTSRLDPEETVSVLTSEGSFTLEADSREVDRLKPSLEQYGGTINWFASGLETIALLNILIGLFNMLPIKPLDGGLAAETLISRYAGERFVPALNKASTAGWGLLLVSLAASLI